MSLHITRMENGWTVEIDEEIGQGKITAGSIVNPFKAFVMVRGERKVFTQLERKALEEMVQAYI